MERLASLASYALSQGAEHRSVTTVFWNVAGDCSNPQEFTLEARRSNTLFDEQAIRDSNHPPLYIDMYIRCRKCEWCLAKRSSLWWFRARNEFNLSSRTWFGTLTLSPEQHYLCQCMISRDLCKSGKSWNDLSGPAQFQARHEVISKEVTRFLKRVRKESGAKLRYLLVLESHKSGLPHYHMLIHEPCDDQFVRKATLHSQWRWGFSSWKLAEDAQSASYLTKYLSKSMLARVRASLHYGGD